MSNHSPMKLINTRTSTHTRAHALTHARRNKSVVILIGRKRKKMKRNRNSTSYTNSDLSLCKCCFYFILFGHIVTNRYSIESTVVLLKQDVRKRWNEEFWHQEPHKYVYKATEMVLFSSIVYFECFMAWVWNEFVL